MKKIGLYTLFYLFSSAMVLGQEKNFCLDQIPLFPSCKSKNRTHDEKCFQKRIEKHIKRTFKYPDFALKNNIKGEVQVYGTILKSGYFKVEALNGPHVSLNNEAKRIMQSLPRLEPGLCNGEPVDVPYSIPIKFKLSKLKSRSKKFQDPFADPYAEDDFDD